MRPKSAITYHYDGAGYTPTRDYAAVNVKIRNGRWDTAIPASFDGEPVHPAFTWGWIDALPDDERDAYWNGAIEDGWERLKDEAENVYGYGARVFSQGRLGGWAVVVPPGWRGGFTRDDVEGWDAIALGRFWQWAKYARQTADDVVYQYLWSLYHNKFLPEQEEHAEQEQERAAGRGTWADVR